MNAAKGAKVVAARLAKLEVAQINGDLPDVIEEDPIGPMTTENLLRVWVRLGKGDGPIPGRLGGQSKTANARE